LGRTSPPHSRLCQPVERHCLPAADSGSGGRKHTTDRPRLFMDAQVNAPRGYQQRSKWLCPVSGTRYSFPLILAVQVAFKQDTNRHLLRLRTPCPRHAGQYHFARLSLQDSAGLARRVPRLSTPTWLTSGPYFCRANSDSEDVSARSSNVILQFDGFRISLVVSAERLGALGAELSSFPRRRSVGIVYR